MQLTFLFFLSLNSLFLHVCGSDVLVSFLAVCELKKRMCDWLRGTLDLNCFFRHSSFNDRASTIGLMAQRRRIDCSPDPDLSRGTKHGTQGRVSFGSDVGGRHHAATVGPYRRANPSGVAEIAETQEIEGVDSFCTMFDALFIAAVARQ